MLSAHALTTIEEVKSELLISGNTEDSYLARLINSASDAIRSYCGRDFAKEQRTERLSGAGGSLLLLPLYPIAEVDSIIMDGMALPPDSYDVDGKMGALIRVGGIWPPANERNITVTYTGGYVTPVQAAADPDLTRNLPYDIEEACIVTAATWASRRSTPRDATTLQVEQIRVTFGDRDRDPAMIPLAVQHLLTSWRRWG